MYNKILVDAPCSGTGVFRKYPEGRWITTPEDVGRFAVMQYSLLNNAARLLSPGGDLVILNVLGTHAENEFVIERFLNEHPGFKNWSCPTGSSTKMWSVRTSFYALSRGSNTSTTYLPPASGGNSHNPRRLMSPLIERYWRPFLTYFIIPLVVFWILFLAVDLMVMPIMTRHGEEFPLPQVVGKSESEAQEILKKQNLSLQVAGREFSANRPEGVILSQLPEAGMPVKSGRSIKVVISAGVRVSEVPDVVGLPLQQAILTSAEDWLCRRRYLLHPRADTLPPDAVVETIPTRGTPLPLNSKVSLAVSQTGEGGQFLCLN